jgi:transcriptional regulator with XRE-family HTH domain
MLSARSIDVNIAAITRERGRRGWTASELAGRAGVSAQTLSNIAHTGRCSPGVLRAIARAFAKATPEPGVDILLADDAA